MAFTYKTIGNMAATVATLLAAGTLLWWQRTPSPVEIPRPQDEAEIMHAVLERHYSMARTTTQFTVSYKTNISKIISDTTNYNATTWATAQALHLTSTLSTGDLYYIISRSYNPDRTCMWNKATLFFPTNVSISSPNLYAVTIRNVMANGSDATLKNTLGGENQIDLGSPYIGWRDTGSSVFPSTLSPESANNLGTVTVKAKPYKYITNSLPHTITNTVGFFPNAPSNYSAIIRSAIQPNECTHWLVPSNSLWTTGSWDGYPQRLGYQFWLADPGAWTNNRSATYLESDTSWWTNCVATNVTTKQFPFERDNKSYWSTNAYNDMARALAAMQWQCQTLGPAPYNQRLRVKWGHSRYADTNRVVIWMEKKDSITITNTYTNSEQNIRDAVAGTDQELDVVGALGFGEYPVSAGYYGHSYFQGVGPDSWVRVAVAVSFQALMFTNNSAFDYTNGMWWISSFGNELSVMTNGVNYVHPFALEVLEHSDTLHLSDVFSLPSGAEITSPMLPASMDDITAILLPKMTTFIDAEYARVVAEASYSSAIPFYPGQDTSARPGQDASELPSWLVPLEYDAINPSATYRVIFQSLTNYANHGTAR